VVEAQKGLLLSASQLRQEYAFSYWDSMIVAAALVSGVKTLYSEDMQHGLTIKEELKIVNPFKS
jgi:predicted nucleic acid-binding protein